MSVDGAIKHEHEHEHKHEHKHKHKPLESSLQTAPDATRTPPMPAGHAVAKCCTVVAQ